MRHAVRRSLAGVVSAALVAVGIGVAVPQAAHAATCATTPMVMTWDSALAGGKVLQLPISAVSGTQISVDWGDSTTPSVRLPGTYALPANHMAHTYAAAGTYTVSICGGLTAMGYGDRFNSFPAGLAGFTAVTSLPPSLINATAIFYQWTNLTDVPSSLPSSVTSLSFAFARATLFNDPDIVSWNLANVTDTSYMFNGAAAFNQPIGSWNTSKVTTMAGMFGGATVFNQPLGSWNTSAVTTTANMFNKASAFDQNIGAWDVSKVTTMEFMFSEATVFNNGGSDTIKNWNTANVTTLKCTFNYANAFNQPIGSWNIAKVTTLNTTFYGAWAFNQNLGAWNTGAVTDMYFTFANAKAFDNGGSDSIGAWNTSKVTTFQATFGANGLRDRPIFNRNIGAWDTSAATTMTFMFSGNTAFNNNGSDSIKNWNTSKVTDFSNMFNRTPFNQPIGSWNVSLATGVGGGVNTPTSLAGMFYLNSAFNQDISAWNPALTQTMAIFWEANQSVMSIANYDKLLNSWSGKVLKSNVTMGFGKHKFSCSAEAARATLSSAPFSWTITDGGLDETAPSISTIVPGNQSLSVYVTAPSCMSTRRTTYEYSTDGGTTWVAVSPGSLASPIVISGLTNGTEYTVQVRAAGGTGNWLPSPAPASTSMKGTPANSTGVTAKNDTSVYGAAVPSIGYDTTLATGDWIDGTITCGAYTQSSAPFTTAVTSSTKPGTYTTHCEGPAKSGLGADLAYTNGTYTVTKAPLTITAKSFTKAYGTALTLDGTADFTVSGLVGSDAVSSVTLTTTGDVAGAGTAGSPYSVVPSAAVGASSQVLTDWYSITYSNGSITVNAAPALSVTPKTFTIDVGSSSLDGQSPGFDATGFVNSESFSTPGYTAPTCAVYDAEVGGTAVGTTYSGLAAGTYWVRCSGGVAGNYGPIAYSTSKFVIKAANIQVTAKNGSSTYGTAPVTDTGYEVAGDLNGVTPTCGAFEDSAGNTAVTATTAPGTYYTVCTGASDNGTPDNTPITYTTGTYTVAKAALTITAKSWSKTYGEAVVPLETSDFTPSGLVNGDTVSSVTLTTTGAVATAGVAGSPYAVTPSAALWECECDITDFYDVTYVPGSITVGKAGLTVTAKDVNLAVGAAVPTSYDYTVAGFVNGEAEDDPVAGWVAPTCTSSFNSTTPAGTPVDVTCSGAESDNYSFTYVAGSVSIGNPEVTVENTTPGAYETSGATANVALSARITDWAPGCKVTFTLDPSTGTSSPYTVYTTASNDVSVNAVLPVGIYQITTSVSEGCTGDPDTGMVAVVPLGPGGAAHIDTYGVKYLSGGKTIALEMEWLRKLAKVRNSVTGLYESKYVYDSYYSWSTYSVKQYRIVSKPFPGQLSIGESTFSTWGRTDCPASLYPVGNASVCSAVTNVVMLQKWVPTAPGSKYGSWSDVGEVLIVEKLAEGLWPYKCATVACKTALPDYLTFQVQPVPGDDTPTTIPAGFPVNTEWTRITAGTIEHKQM